MPSDVLLEASSVTRHGDDGLPIFEPVSLTLCVDDRLALRGASGVGKTLLLRLLTQLDSPDRGAVRFRGQPISADAVPGFRRRVGVLFQSAPMMEGTVGENLELPFALAVARGSVFDRPRALDLLGQFKLAKLYERSVTDLSGGERQVVALVRLLLVEPEVALLDEPTTAMDPERAAVAEALVDEWHAAGPRATIWVSHDAEQLARTTTSSLTIVKASDRDDS